MRGVNQKPALEYTWNSKEHQQHYRCKPMLLALLTSYAASALWSLKYSKTTQPIRQPSALNCTYSADHDCCCLWNAPCVSSPLQATKGKRIARTCTAVIFRLKIHSEQIMWNSHLHRQTFLKPKPMQHVGNETRSERVVPRHTWHLSSSCEWGETHKSEIIAVLIRVLCAYSYWFILLVPLLTTSMILATINHKHVFCHTFVWFFI